MNSDWRALLRRQEEKKQKRVADLKAKLSVSAVPLSKELTDALNQLFVTDFTDVMRHHPGFALENKVRSLKTTFRLFQSTYKDLARALDEFDASSQSGRFASKAAQTTHEELEAKIRKELFCFSSLAHSLQDHCRRLKAEWPLQCFKVHLESCFGVDGLHDFICGLRTTLHHRSMIEADWLLRSTDAGVKSHYISEQREAYC